MIRVTATLDRRDPDDGRTYPQAFTVEMPTGDHVLNLLATIRREHDATLSYPAHFCKLGTCGACALTVDGVPALGCRTIVDANAIRIGPARGRAVAADLLTLAGRIPPPSREGDEE
ncbi:MAG: 2Fe-2S iron-sulfur cluster-binding protein [Alphaproteobacteria bacterium]